MLAAVVLITPPATKQDKNNIFTQYDTSFKAYMSHEAITDKSSDQWALQQVAYTDENGFRRIDDAYCVAIGSYYSERCGKQFTVTLDTGIEFDIIMGDMKSDHHTDETNRYIELQHKDGSQVINAEGIPMVNVLEFIVDINILPYEAKQAGDISVLGLEGNIIAIEEIDNEYNEDSNTARQSK